MAGQGPGEASYSSVNEWPERIAQPPPAATANDKKDAQSPLAALPATPPVDINPGNTPRKTGATSPAGAPTPDQQLDFLLYLVKRGIVNEGFPEGQVPEQYKRHL